MRVAGRSLARTMPRMLVPLVLVLASVEPFGLPGSFGQEASPSEQAAPQRVTAGRLILTRQDLAELVQRLDALLAGPLVRGELTGEALRAASQRFDRISLQFFGGDLAAVHAALSAWIGELSGGAAAPGVLRIDLANEVGFSSRGTWLTNVREKRVRIRAVRPWPELAGTRLRCEIALTPWLFEQDAVPVELEFDVLGRPVPVEVSVVAAQGAGQFNPRVDLFEARTGSHDPVRLVASVDVLRDEPLAARREEIESLLTGATITDEASLRVLRERLSLLVDAPSPERSREFLLATPELAAAIANEARRLCAGERPYRNAFGDLWRTVAHGRRDLAVRVYMPRVLRAEPWPLVVAFHGAGGDENFLFELAGDGYLKQLADEHGFIVVCPMTADFALSAPAFDSLLAGLAADYSIDPTQVFLFGHSMGAGAVSNLCRLRPEAIAKAVCVAGFGGVDADSPPVLVLAGELDPIAPPARLQRGAEAARAAGADVRFEQLADQGHTLLLPAALRRAVEFWSANR